MPISPHYRRFQQQHYLDYSERDAGVTHLWHAHRLAEARLRPGKGITDAPEVDFRHPELMDRSQAKACAVMTRLQRRVLDDEDRITKGNKLLYEHLLRATDDTCRERQGLNNFPSEGELQKWHRSGEHALAWRRNFLIHETERRKNNLRFMKHLVEVKPTVASPKELLKWYNTHHQKRVRDLSRFKCLEPFAGAHVLQSECGVKLSNKKADCVESRTAALNPPIMGQCREVTILDTLKSGTLLPSLQEASQNYVEGNLALNPNDNFASTWMQARRPRKKPEWKSISALDITLMNYANDILLTRGGEFSKVCREEENPVTRLWRESLEKKQRMNERSDGAKNYWDNTTEYNAKDKGRKVSSTAVRWDADRWGSDSNIITLLRSRRASRVSDQQVRYSAEGEVGFNVLPGERQSNSCQLMSLLTNDTKKSDGNISVLTSNKGPLLSYDNNRQIGEHTGTPHAYKGGLNVNPDTREHTGTPHVYKGGLNVNPDTREHTGTPHVYKGGLNVNPDTREHTGTPQAYKGGAVSGVAGGDGANAEEACAALACSTQACMKELHECRTLAGWTAELRSSNTPFVPY